ncbi:MAG: SPFH domain-containing protein [Acidobacteria bacterium]|nr:SPFH domain-containing protein [Acidobacteriota bacterium]
MSDAVEEGQAHALSGWLALPLWLAAIGNVVWAIIGPTLSGGGPPVLAVLAVPVLLFVAKGFTVLQPNMAAVFTFFGRYAGTLRQDGFFWVNPFYSRHTVSLRVHNLNSPTLKVNDRAGNPIEVAAVVVWRVADTAKATFDVQDYVTYIAIQTESAVRAVASSRWYDGDAEGRDSLRGDLEAVADTLAESIQSHVTLAGIEIVEARISHLAYAPEIAGAMLRRQQAQAVVAARAHIVEGAVSMVQLAIAQLEGEKVVELSGPDRVRLVTNLMTVLVGDSDTQPVVSVGKE